MSLNKDEAVSADEVKCQWCGRPYTEDDLRDNAVSEGASLIVDCPGCGRLDVHKDGSR